VTVTGSPSLRGSHDRSISGELRRAIREHIERDDDEEET
jgi:hypothetical protein